MNLSDLIVKKLRFKCKQGIPTKKEKLTKLKKIPSIINLKKNYGTFKIFHNFTDLNIPVLLTENGDFEIEIILNYKYFTYSEIVNLICGRPMPVSYETVGDVIHFNLNDEHLPYKFIIGKILHDKTGCTIINKLGNINSQFRYYDFEYIGGSIDINKIKEHKEVLIEKTKFSTILSKQNGGCIRNDDVKLNHSDTNYNYSDTNYNNSDTNYNHLDKNDNNTDTNDNNTDTNDNILKLNHLDLNTKILDQFLVNYSDSSIIIKMDKLETMLIENGAKFLIDIKNVYWCSKLQDERKRLLSEIRENDIVADVFCGLGPMVVPLLLKKCTVYCNDLNDKAIQCLKKNLEINKIESGFYIENLDAKIFLDKIRDHNIDHFILNLPEYSIEYLQYIKSGLIHCYFFSTENEVEDLVFDKTGLRNQDIRFIRKVSPSKNVYKLTLNKN